MTLNYGDDEDMNDSGMVMMMMMVLVIVMILPMVRMGKTMAMVIRLVTTKIVFRMS